MIGHISIGAGDVREKSAGLAGFPTAARAGGAHDLIHHGSMILDREAADDAGLCC